VEVPGIEPGKTDLLNLRLCTDYKDYRPLPFTNHRLPIFLFDFFNLKHFPKNIYAIMLYNNLPYIVVNQFASYLQGEPAIFA